jgi:cytochrome bd-type quinol oxidase subunit 2
VLCGGKALLHTCGMLLVFVYAFAIVGFIVFPNLFQLRKPEVVDGTTQVCIYSYMYVCVRAYVCMCVCVCVYIYIYIYIYTKREKERAREREREREREI